MQLLRLQPCRGLGAPSLIWRWALQLIGQVLSQPARPALAAVQPPQPADLREAPGMLSPMLITLSNDRALCRRFLRAGVPGRSRSSLCASTMRLCEINRGNLNCPLSLSHRAIFAHPTRIHGAIALPGSLLRTPFLQRLAILQPLSSTPTGRLHHVASHAPSSPGD